MRHYSYFFIISLLIFAQSAWGQCAFYDRRPRTEVVIETGRAVVDNSKARKDFPATTKETTMGLTVAHISHQVELTTEIKEAARQQLCMRVNLVKLIVSIPKLDVYIDKKYKPGSCQYSVISQHEQKHVRIHQDTLSSARAKLQTALDVAIRKIQPVALHPNEDPQEPTNKLLKTITQALKPTIDEIQKETDRKNQRLDTDKAYAADTRKCKKW